MRDLILKILREKGPCQTRVIQQCLVFDHQQDYQISKVRWDLYKMKDENIISLNKGKQLEWHEIRK